jgi:uncharacterized protein
MNQLEVARPQTPSRLKRPWIMAQTWHDLLFAHWPLDSSQMSHLIPGGVELDTFEGQAWVGVVLFRLSGVRLRGLPPMPLVSGFPEVNVRTYVRLGEQHGVYFLSLDADNRLATILARPWFHLAYHYAHIRQKSVADRLYFASKRSERYQPQAEIATVYAPCSRAFASCPGSLEQWLTERYCFFARTNDMLLCCEIDHSPWQLQQARASFPKNTLALAHGIELPPIEPLLHFSRYIQATFCPPRRAVGG